MRCRPAVEVLLSRGPYLPVAERRLMTERRIDLLVTKDSGGCATEAKLQAAAELKVPVVVVRRPAPLPGVEQASSVEEVVEWLSGQAASQQPAGSLRPIRNGSAGRTRTTSSTRTGRPTRNLPRSSGCPW